jgi:stage II sporulation protein GA (sporulation sigma-E factor processing peptidase)
MDFLVIFFVSKLIKKRVRLRFIMLASLVMSFLYCLLIFGAKLNSFVNFLLGSLILISGLAIAFTPIGIKNMIKLFVYAHIITFILGGIGFGLVYYADTSDLLIHMAKFSNSFSIKTLVFSSVIFYLLLKFCNKFFKSLFTKEMVYPIRIHCEDLEVNLAAMIDTGNSLKDSVSNFPVIVAEYESVKKLLPDKFEKVFYTEPPDFSLIDSDDNFCKRISIIPFTSIGKTSGILLGFRPDKIEIDNNSKIISTDKVVVGIYNRALSTQGEYQVLLNYSFFNELA